MLTLPSTHTEWTHLPPGHNIFSPLVNDLRTRVENMGIKIDQTPVAYYDCFFVALFKQAAAYLGIEKIDKGNIETIVEYLEKLDNICPLPQWGSWGISSAQKTWKLLEILRQNGQENFLLFGNGGVMNNGGITLLTKNKTTALKAHRAPNLDTEPQGRIRTGNLISDPSVLGAGKQYASGTIGEIAFQNSSEKRPTERGTIVRVELPDGNFVLTNLAISGDKESLYKNLSIEYKIGQTVRFEHHTIENTIQAVSAKIFILNATLED